MRATREKMPSNFHGRPASHISHVPTHHAFSEISWDSWIWDTYVLFFLVTGH